MSSHQDPYYPTGPNPIYYESGSESPVSGQLPPPGQSWPPTATTSNRSGYSQPHQSLDPVRNLLEVYDVEDANYPLNYPGPSSSLPTTLSQDPGVGTGATYTNDDIPFHPFVNLPFYPHSELEYGHSQYQYGYAPYNQLYDSSTPHLVPHAHEHPAQDIHAPQTSQGPLTLVHPCSSSTQVPSLGHGGPVYWNDAGAAHPAPDSLTPGGANTARTNAGAGQHSHLFPVATPTNQSSAPGPSRPPPSSPERKRLLPLAAADEHSTTRRVVPRHERAISVHSTSSDSAGRRRSVSVVYGRGPVIPQERYTTSTVPSHNADQHRFIPFSVEDPDQTGIPIVDILNKTDGFARLRDRTEPFEMGKMTFTLRLLWPGYKPWHKTIAAKNWRKMRGPVTRVKLAEAVATAVRELFEAYHDDSYDTDYAEWNVGPNGIQLDQICLVALHQVSKGSWQPELCLVGPRR